MTGFAIACGGCSSVDGSHSPSGSSRPSAAPPTAVVTPAVPEVTDPRELPTTEADLFDEVEFATGVSVVIDGVTTTQVTATTPGEVDGTACVVTVAVHNGSASAVDLASAVVTATAAGSYGVQTTAGPAAPFSGTLPPGASTAGTYVFMLDPQGQELTITVNYAAGQPVVVFHGKSA